jgi:hypothetical protein
MPDHDMSLPSAIAPTAHANTGSQDVVSNDQEATSLRAQMARALDLLRLGENWETVVACCKDVTKLEVSYSIHLSLQMTIRSSFLPLYAHQLACQKTTPSPSVFLDLNLTIS